MTAETKTTEPCLPAGRTDQEFGVPDGYGGYDIADCGTVQQVPDGRWFFSADEGSWIDARQLKAIADFMVRLEP